MFFIIALFAGSIFANPCACIYKTGFYKQMKEEQKKWWGKKIRYDCDYECTNGRNTVMVRAEHKTWYLGKEEGDEFVCEGTVYIQKYGADWFYWDYQGSKSFPAKKSSSPDLKNWAAANCN